jgi:hypothetical protein
MMGERKLFIDSDILVLLSGAGLLDRVLKMLDFERIAAYRLSALPHMIRRGKKFQQLCDPITRNLALEACQTLNEITDRPSDKLFQKLLDFSEIDEGEALLYGLLVEQPSCLLASADKRAMLIVGSLEDPTGIRDSILGRIITLETVLHQLVNEDGVEPIAEAFDVFPSHKTLQVIFSSANSTDQERCLASLESYLHDMKRTVGEDFFYEM